MIKFDNPSGSAMSQELFKTPKSNKGITNSQFTDCQSWPPRKRRRTKEDFSNFCDIVLQYTKYESERHKDMNILRDRNNTSPMDSGGSAAESFSSESDSPTISPTLTSNLSLDHSEEVSVTCFCRKPFSGRPMILCSVCDTWLHLSCVKVRKNNIPDIFVCAECRESQHRNKRKSNRNKMDKQLSNA